MTSWFRSWHGAPTDMKWLAVARRANVAPGIVSAVVWALFDAASQADTRGDTSGFDVEAYAAFSGFDEADIEAVMSALRDKGIVSDGHLTAWAKRQPAREDSSAERVRRHREKKRSETSGDAAKRDVTQCNAPEKNRTEQKEEGSYSAGAREPALVPLDANGRSGLNAEFARFMDDWPESVGRVAASRVWPAARAKASVETILEGVDHYKRHKPPDRQWMSPAKFLEDERWTDRYAEQPANRSPNPGSRTPSGADGLGHALAGIVQRERERGHGAPDHTGEQVVDDGSTPGGGARGPVLALVAGGTANG